MRWLDKLIVYVMFVALWILVMPRAKADEFDDVFAKYKAAKAKPAPRLAIDIEQIAAPKDTYKHDCGCPLLQCNCGSEGCHCSENRLDNRQPARWVRDGDYWYLYRGSQCLGVMKVNGTKFFQWNGTDYLPTPMKPPTVPPYRAQEQSRAMQQAPVCRT